jgi:hypothetical protein
LNFSLGRVLRFTTLNLAVDVRAILTPCNGPVAYLPYPLWRKAPHFRGFFAFLFYDVAPIQGAYNATSLNFYPLHILS